MPRKNAKVDNVGGQVQISGGTLRGRSLDCPQTGGVRPMLSRTRMALYNVISEQMKNATVWDCFAGSGLLGFECISRGAKHCMFIEKDTRHARIIGSNIQSLELRDRANVLAGSIFDLVKPNSPRLPHTPADILLLDPPHAMIEKLDDGPFFKWLRGVPESPLGRKGLLACIGHPKVLDMPELEAFSVLDKRVYGSVAFTVLEQR
ncbi:RsmD family RNA methyltransferase [Planctomycetota bacterium]|nr:RsmD family RNA methyltransferase [Planctomycetota bacterium]